LRLWSGRRRGAASGACGLSARMWCFGPACRGRRAAGLLGLDRCPPVRTPRVRLDRRCMRRGRSEPAQGVRTGARGSKPAQGGPNSGRFSVGARSVYTWEHAWPGGAGAGGPAPRARRPGPGRRCASAVGCLRRGAAGLLHRGLADRAEPLPAGTVFSRPAHLPADARHRPGSTPRP